MTEFTDPGSVLGTAERARWLARGDRRASSVPLVVFGGLCLASAPLAEGLSPTALVYWAVAGPAGFLLTAWWYRRHRLRTGVGAGRSPYGRTGLGLLVASALLLPLSAVRLPVLGGALLVIAVRQRNAYLAFFAAAFGVLGGLEQFAVLDNLLYRAAYRLGWFTPSYGYFEGAPQIVTALLALLLLGAGLYALGRERRATP